MIRIGGYAVSQKYDPTNIESIVEYAQKLEGHTLRELTDATDLQDPKQRRGSFGNAVEDKYFGYDINSSPEPDFAEVGLELKTTPEKRNANGKVVAKERLVLTMIDYDEVVNETFETSHLLEKAKSILLVVYMWEKDKNPLDYKIDYADLWGLPEEDMPQFKADWETVVDKVRTGHAEDISSSDTMYLEACTKAADSSVRRSQPYSDVPAKPRAWALKASYMTVVETGLKKKRQAILRSESERHDSLIELLYKRFRPYLGSTQEELFRRFGLGKSGSKLPKSAGAMVTKYILGIDQDAEIDEFAKAGIHTKTIRLMRSGRPKEAISFPAIDYIELEQTPFEKSDFYEDLQRKWLFVIFREAADGEFRLSDLCFWQMPDSDIPEAKRCYDQMQANVRAGRADISVRSSENRCCHVRPHAQNKADTRPQPHGRPVEKKSFWLNQTYLKEEIRRQLELQKKRGIQ